MVRAMPTNGPLLSAAGAASPSDGAGASASIGESPTIVTARAMKPTPHHIAGVRRSPRANCFISATKTIPPPRSSIQIDAEMCMRPATMRSTDSRSKTAGRPSISSVLTVTGGSASIAALRAGSCLALRARSHSVPKYIGSANSMPKNMSHDWKTCGLNGSSSPFRPSDLSSKRVFEKMTQPVPATRPMTKTADAWPVHGFSPAPIGPSGVGFRPR
mmetsp:Transcript_28079/g.94353  ORF Transcript_28079/g.94353 Transcript_28079/m.94353 type:complete len:216 (+) Transcript_28079:346-993(+)